MWKCEFVKLWIHEIVNSWNCEFVKLWIREVENLCGGYDKKKPIILANWKNCMNFTKVYWDNEQQSQAQSDGCKYRWHSDQLDGTENSRELLCQTKVMQIRQGETLNHQTIKEICHKMKNCFKNIGSVIYIFTDANNRIKLFLQFTLWFQYENTEFPILPHSKIWLLDS